MMDVNYFIEEASCFNQEEFEINFADVIEVFDTNETHLTTEDRKKLIITWNNDGTFKFYHVVYETAQMEQHAVNVNRVINILRDIEIDGETMQYIIEKVGMTDQMLRQLIMTNPYTDTSDLLEEKVRLSDAGIHF